MGDEVKITVIATGFRDQMPERRARMLNVEEMPVVSVPVVATDAWMREKPPVPPPAPPPAPRFMSEEDDENSGTEADEPAFVVAASRSRIEAADETSFVPHPRDYASDFGNSTRTPSITEEHVSPPTVSPLPATPTDEERDLDVPTFMRRMKF
jgi:cell division protein FtsZ